MAEEGICETTILHPESVAQAARGMPGEAVCGELADLFSILGDGTRVKILSALSFAELCVCDLSALLRMSQSAISHQLSLLKRARLVKFRKEGKSAYYCLDDSHVKELLSRGLEHVMERKHEDV